MVDSDILAFSDLLDRTCMLLSRGTYAPNAENTTLWYRALEAHDLASVRAAFDAHIRTSKFVPSPADILQHIATNDGRLGPEEAWAIALRGADEAATVVWNDEIGRAWSAALPVWELGDEVGARMAFKEAYTRIVAESRRMRKAAPAWVESLGFDKAQRDEAIEAAAVRGLLPAPKQLAIPSDAMPSNPQRRDRILQRFQELRAQQQPLDWARRLKASHEAGAVLSPASVKAYQDALAGAPQREGAPTGFKPIPTSAWPPNMRPRDQVQPPIGAYDEAEA